MSALRLAAESNLALSFFRVTQRFTAYELASLAKNCFMQIGLILKWPAWHR